MIQISSSGNDIKEPRFEGLLDTIRLRLHLLATEMRAMGMNEVRHMPLRSVNRVRNVLSRILVKMTRMSHM